MQKVRKIYCLIRLRQYNRNFINVVERENILEQANSSKDKEIVVSVLCAVYNHQKYLRQTLESFVMQKTDFLYEIIVHDDASTDNSRQIIMEFAEKYPQIIKPIYQNENQYSKGKYIIGDFMFPAAKGEFLAWCEGDDYWTDKNKLQKQVDALRRNPDCFFCTHTVPISHDGIIEGCFPAIKIETGVYSTKEVLAMGYFQTSSFMIKKEKFREYLHFRKTDSAIAGSESILMYMALIGNTYYINERMSMYRILTPGSWTSRQKKDKEKQIINRLRFISMLDSFNKFSKTKYETYFKRRINEEVISYLALCDKTKRLISESYSDLKKYFLLKTRVKVFIWEVSPKLYEFLIKKMG